jgi:hypothetical protein
VTHPHVLPSSRMRSRYIFPLPLGTSMVQRNSVTLLSLRWHYSPKRTLASSIKSIQLFLSSASFFHLDTQLLPRVLARSIYPPPA